jgi:hypothetical protein
MVSFQDNMFVMTEILRRLRMTKHFRQKENLHFVQNDISQFVILRKNDEGSVS